MKKLPPENENGARLRVHSETDCPNSSQSETDPWFDTSEPAIPRMQKADALSGARFLPSPPAIQTLPAGRLGPGNLPQQCEIIQGLSSALHDCRVGIIAPNDGQLGFSAQHLIQVAQKLSLIHI